MTESAKDTEKPLPDSELIHYDEQEDGSGEEETVEAATEASAPAPAAPAPGTTGPAAGFGGRIEAFLLPRIYADNQQEHIDSMAAYLVRARRVVL